MLLHQPQVIESSYSFNSIFLTLFPCLLKQIQWFSNLFTHKSHDSLRPLCKRLCRVAAAIFVIVFLMNTFQSDTIYSLPPKVPTPFPEKHQRDKVWKSQMPVTMKTEMKQLTTASLLLLFWILYYILASTVFFLPPFSCPIYLYSICSLQLREY